MRRRYATIATLGVRALAGMILIVAYFMFWEPVRRDLITFTGEQAARLAGTELAVQAPQQAIAQPDSSNESQKQAIQAYFSDDGIHIRDAGGILSIRATDVDPNKQFSFTGFVRKQVPFYLALLILIGASLKEGILLVVFYIATTFMSLGLLWGALVYSPLLLYAMDFTVIYLARFLPLMWLLIRLKRGVDEWRSSRRQ